MKIMVVSLFLLALIVVAAYTWWPFDRAPSDSLTHFYRCQKCGCVYGPLQGKGPFLRLPREKGKWCVHEWKETTKADFDVMQSDYLKKIRG